MTPLAAGNTATFTTKPIPATSVPTATNIVWTSSDTVNAAVKPNAADTTGLSVQVSFLLTTPAGISFTLTVSYTNSDGTRATQVNTFVTVVATNRLRRHATARLRSCILFRRWSLRETIPGSLRRGAREA